MGGLCLQEGCRPWLGGFGLRAGCRRVDGMMPAWTAVNMWGQRTAFGQPSLVAEGPPCPPSLGPAVPVWHSQRLSALQTHSRPPLTRSAQVNKEAEHRERLQELQQRIAQGHERILSGEAPPPG